MLVPTRELGVQVYEVSRKLAQFAQHIDIGLAVGGLDLKAQVICSVVFVISCIIFIIIILLLFVNLVFYV